MIENSKLLLNRQKAIGVFDSGVGGITVLKALLEALPDEKYVYLGDTARLPYGTKSPETVAAYAVHCCDHLMNFDIKMLVVACNSASAWALPSIQARWPHLLVLGVIYPTAVIAHQSSQSQRHLLLATEATIQSGLFPTFLKEFSPQAHIQEQPAPLLVPFAEEGWTTGDIPKAILSHYVSSFFEKENYPDCLILGCTHYPAFKEALKEIIPSDVSIVDSAQPTAQRVAQILSENGLLRQKSTGSFEPLKNVHFLVTDAPDKFQRVSQHFLRHQAPFDIEKIDL